MELVVSLIVGAVLGGLASWLISRHYYRAAAADATEAFLGQRLDDLPDGDRSFLVALFQAERPIPRYSLIQVEYETPDGATHHWGSNAPTMIRSVNAHTPHSFRFEGEGGAVDLTQTVALSDRGRENAEYLVRHGLRKAHFTDVEASDQVRRSLQAGDKGAVAAAAVSVSGRVTDVGFSDIRLEP